MWMGVFVRIYLDGHTGIGDDTLNYIVLSLYHMNALQKALNRQQSKKNSSM